MKHLLFSLLVILAIPAPGGGGYVHDFADILPPETESHLESLLSTVEAHTTAEIAVVTVASLEGMTVERFANQLFNKWGIGQRETNNGVLLLIAPYERRTRIEVGYGLESLLTDGLCSDIVNDILVPHFKQKDYPGGATEGAEFLARVLTDHPSAARGVAGSTPWYLSTPRSEAGLTALVLLAGIVVFLIWISIGCKNEIFTRWSFWVPAIGLAGFAVYAAVKLFLLPRGYGFFGYLPSLGAGGGLVYGIRKYFRYGPHRCRRCGALQQLLSESKDDEHLSETQLLEEQLGSVDYDIWFCPGCLKTDTSRYLDWFSNFIECPKCAVVACKVTTEVVTAATTSSTGTRSVTEDCVHCGHRATRYETIPRKSSSSSSSGFGGGGGGGFGGGSSGGGGASGGW